MTLEVVPSELVASAAQYDQNGSEILQGSQSDPAVVASMNTAYGPIGASFVTAIGTFETAFQASGTQVANDYRGHAESLRQAASKLTDTDQNSAGRF